jgi:hypothetical protein
MIRIALLAGICMIIQDSLAVIKYQAAARNRGFIVAGADVIIWVFSITCTTIAAFALHGHSMSAKIAVVIDVDNNLQNDRLDNFENRIVVLENLTKNKG